MARQELNVFRMRLLGCRGRPGAVGEPHPQGRRQRGHARLGRHRRVHRTTASVRSWGPIRTRGWCGSSIGSSATRPGRSASSTSTVRSPTSWSPASAVGRTRPASSRASPRTVGRPRRGGAGRRRRGRPRRARHRPRHAVVPRSRTSSDRCPRPSRSPPASTTRASARSMPTSPSRAGPDTSVTDTEVIDAFRLLSRTEGIIPALEPAHALAWVSRERASLAGRTVLINLSGRGDKDVAQMMDILGGRSVSVRDAARDGSRRSTPAASASCRT